MPAYYNEFDPYAAQWLRNLIEQDLIAPGEVDERDIRDVTPSDLAGFSQCHFFAGVGVWSYALRLAGVPDSARVWTGSCPCQPFSAAGKGDGFDDERHLWPAFFHLIQQCQPPVVIGEQVASKNADPWLDLVQNDLEALGYAFGAVAFPSAGVGAPHMRDRTYWVVHAERAGLEGHRGHEHDGHESGRLSALEGRSTPEASAVSGFWRGADWLPCRDGKERPVEPGTFPLVNGAPARVGRLRADGNAINAQAAKEFIEACLPVD